MFYKVEKGCDLYDSLQQLLARMKEVREEAKKFTEEIPNSISTYIPQRGLAGGVMHVGFSKEEDVPTDWIIKHREGGNVYATPRGRRNSVKEIRLKMEALPVLSDNELNELVDYDPWLTVDTTSSIWWKPGYVFKDDMVLLTVSEEQVDAGYKPVEGMVEITKSEFDTYTKEEKQVA